LEIIVFILLAGVWAAFLLPSFFDHRRQTPQASTRDFARSTAKLASVSARTNDGGMSTSRAHAKRRNILIALGIGAAATLVAAVLTGSVVWLAVAIVFDILIAVYVGLLLYIKEQRAVARATVVPIRAVEETPALRIVEPAVEETPATVRVIAG
jgi:Flp pilus assembly protein TadB